MNGDTTHAPATAPTPTTTIPTPPTSSALPDSAENLRLMMEGRVFDRFVMTAPPIEAGLPPTIAQESVFLWYEPSMKLGTFYWCEPGRRDKVDEQAIPLQSISDIFLGRQTPELKSPLAAAGAADQCFSITSKRTALHLRGESAAVRTAFLAGIRHVWTKPTMVTQQTPNIQQMTQGGNFIAVMRPPSAAADGTATPPPPVLRDVFVWYEREDSKLGTLHWCDVGSRVKVPGQSLQLHRISDVYLGKQAAEMKGPEVATYPSHNCFSAIAKDKAVHLIAPSEAVRTTWLAGIRDVFANVGKKASDQKDSKERKSLERGGTRSSFSAAQPAAAAAVPAPAAAARPATPAAAPIAALNPPLAVIVPSDPSPDLSSFTPRPDPPTAAPIAPADRPSPLEVVGSSLLSPTTSAAISSLHKDEAVVKSKTSLLEHGHHFTSFVGLNPTAVQRVFVWYDSKEGKLGTLYWNDSAEGLKNRQPDCSIPFHRITDVFMGKQSAELKSPEAATYESNHCFSVVGKERSLQLAAESASVRLDFLSNIKQIFLTSGRRVDEERAKLEKRNLAQAEGANMNLPALTSEYLERGAQFTSYEDDDVVLDVLVWYANHGSELGYIYWSETGEKVERESHRLAVPFISDIYMGKQTPQLEGYTAADAPDNCCFSLVSSDRSLHLKALTHSQRTDFLSALRDLFVLAGKRTQQEAQELMIQQALLNNPKRALLMKGSRFVGMFGKQPTERMEVLVWYAPEDGKSGTLYWSADGQREKSAERSIPLHRVSDVFMGKQTAELKSDVARDIQTNRCFSVLTKDRGLHLAALDEQQRGDWLSAIKSVFIESGKRVDDEKERAKAKKEAEAAARLAAAQQSTIGPNQQAMDKEAAINNAYSQQGAVVPMDALLEGRDYLAIFPSSLASGPLHYWSRPIHVFVQSGGGDSVGVLYWCERGGKETADEQSIPLSRVSDVFIGKHTDEFRSNEGGRYDSKQCVSVVSKLLPHRSLHLVAKDEKGREEFVTSLRAAFARSSKPGFNLEDPQSIIAMMVVGEEVVSYIGSGIIGSSSPAFVWFVPKDGKQGTVYWNDEGRKDKVPGLSLAINHITDVFLGKKTPELLSVEGIFANTDHCLSIMSRKTSLHMEFKTRQLRDAWLIGIKNAYAQAGRPVKESKPGDAPGTRITTIISAKKPDAVKVSPVLLEGRPFVRYQHVNGSVKKKRIHLWLVKEDGPLGTLYWEDMVPAGQKQALVKKPDACIPVNKISDVYIGKQTPLFQQAELSSVPLDCCLSIASKEITLDLAAKYPRDRKEWLTAIHTVFLSSGKKVVENEPSVHKVVLDQPVWTPFGEGLAERYPRNDGITTVQLAWAVGYLNNDSVHRLVQVETPLGLARLLPLDRQRADGTVRVQLPWGESYVSRKDIRPLATTSAPSSREPSPRTSVVGTPATSTPTVGAVTRPTSAVPSLSSTKPIPIATISPSAPREVKRVYSKDEANAVLSRGTPFTLVTPSRSLPIVCWLSLEEGVLGTLYYNPAGDGSDRAEHSIPVHTISDIYLGNLRFPAYPTTPDRALSICGRGEVWDLVADTIEQRSAWYYALHSLISSSGKDVVSEEKPSPAGLGLTSHHFHYQKPAEPDYQEATAVLKQGGHFTQHVLDAGLSGGETRTLAVFVYYDERDGELGALCTSATRGEEKEEKGGRGAVTESWRLEDIRDLFLGNRNFRKQSSVRVENDHCMSVVLKDKQELNLEAANKQQRDSLFYSLVSVLKHGPKLDDDYEEEESVQSQSPQQQPQQPPQQLQQVQPVPTATAAALATISAQPPPRAGAVLAPAVLQPVADSALVRTEQPQQLPSSAPVTPAPTTTTPAPITPLASSTPTPTPLSSGSVTPTPGSNLVAEGVEMTVWTGDEQHASAVRQFVYWDPPEAKRRLGTLRWCAPGRRERVEGQELPMHHITDVFLGRHSTALKSPEAAAASSSSRCFVLSSKAAVFSAECSSDRERDVWLKAFKRMFTASGKAVVDQKKRSSTGSGGSGSAAANAIVNTTPSTASSSSGTDSARPAREEREPIA